MSFDSPLFLFFFSAVLILFQWSSLLRPLIIVTGLAFMLGGGLATATVFLAMLVLSTLSAYVVARFHRRLFFVLALIAHFSVWIYFRISHDFGGSDFFPVGLSFYTFAAVTYLVAIEFEDKSFRWRSYLSSLSFFPTLTAGPICRLPDLEKELEDPQKLDWERARYSCVMITNGFFKKGLAEFATASIVPGLTQLHPLNGTLGWLQVALFAAKYYLDFSGYADIAVGTASLLGVSVPPNFRLPFLATSMADYWRRWHMSLNFWMRDYVFRPLVYSKALWFLGRYRLYAAILFSMLFIGIWHGFTWNFIVWGLYMGALICLELVFEPWLERIPKIFRIGLTFWLLLNSYVIFMNQNIQQVKVYFSKMYSDVSVQSVDVPFAIVIAILIVGPHIVDAVLLRFEYFRKETALAIVASLAFLLCHYWLDGFNGAPFEYFKF